jgi:adenosylmethionine-8-amino-7-oxononanoate aminotransferase
MIVSAKGLSGGYMPLSTVIFSDAIAAVFEQAGTPFVHNYTYEAHPVAAAAALAVLRILERDGLVENAARQGDYLLARLRGLAEQQPLVGDVRGKGLLTAFELVADRQTRAPLPPELGVTARLHRLVRERGVLIYPGAGADGVVGDQFLVSPPLVVTRADIDEIVGRIALALSDLTRELPV